MNSIDDYIDLAKQHQGFDSDRKLSIALGVRGDIVSDLRTGRSLPTDNNMVKIAELGGQDPELALIQLNFWRTARRNEPAAAQLYKKMIETMGKSAAACAVFMVTFSILFTPSPSHAGDITGDLVKSPNIYYAYFFCIGLSSPYLPQVKRKELLSVVSTNSSSL